MKRKSIVLIATAVMLMAAMVVGGTLAYFTDTDSAENVMTTGKVDIKQLEEKRFFDDNGNFWTLGDFEDNVSLMPMVDARKDGEATVVADEKLGWNVFHPNMKNVFDKFVRVTNVAEQGAINQDVYARTIIAFETARHYAEGSTTEFTDMHDVYIGVNGTYDYVKDAAGQGRYITVDDVEYVLAECVYEKALAPQETSPTSLRQVFLAPTAGNEVADIFGSEYTILCLSQATQTAGFDSAKVALDTAFGDLSTMDINVIQGWFEAVE